jgi:hypothetical protein
MIMHRLSVVDDALEIDDDDPSDDPDAAVDGAVYCAVANRTVLESIAAKNYAVKNQLCIECKSQQDCQKLAGKYQAAAVHRQPKSTNRSR